MTLSTIIITFNEEKNIRRCLESVVDVSDEIIVVDSFSTDATEGICKEYPVQFIKHEFEGYIQQKNIALSYSNNKYVLSLDADEALSDQLKQSIQEEKKEFTKDAYSMNRLTNYCGKWIRNCGWYPDRKIRLFNREKAWWGGINPHDKIMMDKRTAVGHLKGDLLHYSYYTREDHLNQIENFSSIGARELMKKNKSWLWLKMYISPVGKFIRDYFIKTGFLDGKAGFHISRLSAMATYKKYRKYKDLLNEQARQNQ